MAGAAMNAGVTWTDAAVSAMSWDDRSMTTIVWGCVREHTVVGMVVGMAVGMTSV